MGFVLFCNPGTYLAITGLGAGGKQPQLIGIVNKANVILYCLFGASGILGGSIINKIGPRWALMIGATGYPMYAGSLWYVHLRQPDSELKSELLESNIEIRTGGLTRAKAAGLFCLAALGWASLLVFSGLHKVCQ